MNKIAILGVASSGKTVLLAGLGGRYEKADANGCFLVPESRETMAYVKRLLSCMKRREWPAATTPDSMQQLVWSIRRRTDEGTKRVGDLTVLDFAGEVYRAAFEGASQVGFEDEIKALLEYVSGATALAVLINLSDLIALGDEDTRVADMVWTTKKILDFAVESIGASQNGDLGHRVALVFTQTDRYSSTIGQYAGLKAMFDSLLPIISQSYSGLDILSAHVVDGTDLDDNGMELPRPVLSENGMCDFWRWLIARCESDGFRPRMGGSAQRHDVAPLASVASLAESIAKAASSDDFYLKGHSPNAKLSNAMSAMKVRESSGDVFLQFDGTVFGSAAEGLLITSKAIYGKDLWEDPFRVPLNSDFTVVRHGFCNNLLFHWSEESVKHKNTVLMTGLSASVVDEIARLITEWRKGRYEN